MTLILKGHFRPQKASDFGGIFPDALGTFQISAALPFKKTLSWFLAWGVSKTHLLPFCCIVQQIVPGPF